ncbi:MAG: PAS domain S-box protein [Nitrospirae bacterium]|nr:PAS domain S-box protein [Nitrospirota bacterium]
MSVPQIRVLLIEDNPGDVRLIQEMLRESPGVKFDFASAGSLAEGFEDIEKGSVDIVLLDLGLPDSQGLATLAATLSKRPEMPIIVLTGLTDETAGVNAVNEGAQDYLIKGQFESALLVRSVRYAIERKHAEESLKQNLRLNQILLDSFPCVALLLRPETREIVASNQAAKNVGAVPGMRCFSTWGQRESPCPWCLAPKLWATGRPQQLEIEALGVVWDAHWIPVSPGLYMHFAFDITERRRAASEINFLASIVRNVPDAICSVDLNANITSWNKGAQNMLGYAAEEVMGKPVTVTIPEEIAQQELDHCIGILNRDGFFTGYESARIGKNGRRVPVEIAAVALKDEKGAVTSYTSIMRDITERKKAEQEIAEALEFNREIFKASSIAILIYDRSGQCVSANEAAARSAGATVEQLLGQNYRNLESWRTSGMAKAAEAALSTGVEQMLDAHVVSTFGKELWAACRFVPFRTAGESHLLTLLTDITERKKGEEQLKEINECFLEFVPDPHENIQRLTALCGKLMRATAALYNRLDKGMLCSFGRWNTPPDYNPEDKPEGHICYDVITKGGDRVFVVRNLSKTRYAKTDPNVIKYKLETYVGTPVMFGDAPLGSLCVLYQDDFIPSEADKRLMGILASAIAVEERRGSGEKALRESEERLRLALGAANQGLYDLNIQTGETVVTPEYALMLGYDPGEFHETNAQWIERLHPEERKRVTAVYRAYIAGELSEYRVEFRQRMKSGNWKWILSMGKTVERDSAGKPLRMLGTHTDITERKKAEEELMLLYRQIKEEAEISHSLVRIVNALNTSLSESELIRNVMGLVPNYLRFDRTMIFLYDEALRGFVFSAGHGLTPVEEGVLVSRTFREEDFPAMAEFLRGEEIVIENAAENALLTKELIETFRIGSIVMVPITVRGKVIGGIVGNYRKANPIDRKDLMLIKGLADGIAVALQNSRLYKESLERLMELSVKIETIKTMSQFDKEILSSIDRDSILKTAAAMINRIIPCDRAAVVLKEGAGCRVVSEWGAGTMVDKTYPLKELHFEAFDKNRVSLYLADLPADTCPYHRELSKVGIISALLVPLVTKDGVTGFLDVGSTRPGRLTAGHLTTAENLASQIAVALENARLYEELQELLINTITSLASAIDAKSPWTKGHSERVTKYAVEIGREMGLGEEELERLKLSGLLHDIGKIGTYDLLLNKLEKFTAEEFALVRKHPGKGAEILAPIKQLSDVIPGILHHHERYDGKGYPAGIKGEKIPLFARILCAADSFDAMTADRPYRAAPGREYAISELKGCCGTQFDPRVVEAFLRVLERWNG